jgi:hypothetical protein
MLDIRLLVVYSSLLFFVTVLQIKVTKSLIRPPILRPWRHIWTAPKQLRDQDWTITLILSNICLKLKNILFPFQIFPNASLSIQHLSEIDEGDYVCSVQNAHGSDQVRGHSKMTSQIWKTLYRWPSLFADFLSANSLIHIRKKWCKMTIIQSKMSAN